MVSLGGRFLSYLRGGNAAVPPEKPDISSAAAAPEAPNDHDAAAQLDDDLVPTFKQLALCGSVPLSMARGLTLYLCV